MSRPVGSEVGLLDTRGSAGRLRGANVSCAGVIGQGLEERPGRGSVKRQAKGLGLEFSGTREPLMISGPVGDLINICAREAGMGGRPCLSHRRGLESGPVRGGRKGVSQAEPPASDPLQAPGVRRGSPAPLGSFAPSTRDTVRAQSQPGSKFRSAPHRSANDITSLGLFPRLCVGG